MPVGSMFSEYGVAFGDSDPARARVNAYDDEQDARDHVALYIVRSFRQTAPPQPNREIVAHGFFATDALPADTSRATRERIAEVLTGRPPAEIW